jgi:hypothetical protein
MEENEKPSDIEYYTDEELPSEYEDYLELERDLRNE